MSTQKYILCFLKTYKLKRKSLVLKSRTSGKVERKQVSNE